MTVDRTPIGLSAWIPGFLSAEAQPERVAEWVARTQDAIRAQLPDLVRQEAIAELLHEAIDEHWRAFLREFSQPEMSFHLIDAGRRLATEMAAHQLPVETLIKVYRVAQQDVWAYVTRVVNQIPADHCDSGEALIYFWSRAGSWFDASIEASTEVYQAEWERVASGAAAQRYAVVREVLAGRVDDVRRISASLGGYPLSVHHTALIASAPGCQDVAVLEGVVAAAARALGAGQPLVVQPGGRRVWAWIGTRDIPDLNALDHLLPTLREHKARLAVGTPVEGLAGFVTSHEEALAAHEVAARSTSCVLTRYEHVELASLLDCSPRVDRFMLRVLGGLAGADDATQRLRETVAAFLANGGNVEDCARQLCVHRNTVRYRISQAEELLGRPVNKLGGELGVALQHHETYHATDVRASPGNLE